MVSLEWFIAQVFLKTYAKVIGTFSRYKNVKWKAAFAIVALHGQLSAGAALLEDFALVRELTTLVLSHGSAQLYS